MLPFRGVLLDLWGTLAPDRMPEGRRPHLHAMARALGAEPVAFERAWASSIGARCTGALGSLEETVRGIAHEVGVDPGPEEVREAIEIRLAFSRSALEASRAVLPALDALRDAKLRLALVTDTTAETPMLWPSIPLSRRIDVTVFSCLVGFCKPDPRTYRLAYQGLGLAPSECAYIGDGGSHELTGARTQGLTAFLCRFPGQPLLPEYRYEPDADWRGPALRVLTDLLAHKE